MWPYNFPGHLDSVGASIRPVMPVLYSEVEIRCAISLSIIIMVIVCVHSEYGCIVEIIPEFIAD